VLELTLSNAAMCARTMLPFSKMDEGDRLTDIEIEDGISTIKQLLKLIDNYVPYQLMRQDLYRRLEELERVKRVRNRRESEESD
jgi:hypothetical protein